MTDQAVHSGDSPTGASEEMGGECRLQDGIYFRKLPRIGPCYRLLLLNIKSSATPREAKDAIAAVWNKVQGLGQGLVADQRSPGPAGRDQVQGPELTCLLGFGARLFQHYPALSRPEGLTPLADQPFPSLGRVDEQDRRIGEAELVVQLIARTELAVNQALVEVWMLTRSQPLELVTFHDGFKRGDGRSWLGFHDGISNIERDQRRKAIEVVRQDSPWMEGGTYMAFLRVAIDLEVWRGLQPEHRDSLVGRGGETGCPLASIEPPMRPVLSESRPDSPEYINPPPVLGAGQEKDLLRASHIYRANPNRNADDRIFRQGFDFVEPLEGGRLRLGLNFVSFQRELIRLTNIFLKSGWLRDVNFGGVPDAPSGQPQAITLMKLVAGGYYAVPPKGEPFPGADIF